GHVLYAYLRRDAGRLARAVAAGRAHLVRALSDPGADDVWLAVAGNRGSRQGPAWHRALYLSRGHAGDLADVLPGADHSAPQQRVLDGVVVLSVRLAHADDGTSGGAAGRAVVAAGAGAGADGADDARVRLRRRPGLPRRYPDAGPGRRLRRLATLGRA